MMPGPEPVIVANPASARSLPDLDRGGILRIFRIGARGTEYRYGFADVREFVEPFDELAHDAQHAPGVAAREVIGMRQSPEEVFHLQSCTRSYWSRIESSMRRWGADFRGAGAFATSAGVLWVASFPPFTAVFRGIRAVYFPA